MEIVPYPTMKMLFCESDFELLVSLLKLYPWSWINIRYSRFSSDAQHDNIEASEIAIIGIFVRLSS